MPRISYAKIKEGVFVGRLIRELIEDVKCEDQLTEVEETAWKSLKNVTTNFVVIWWLILYSPTKLRGVICL